MPPPPAAFADVVATSGAVAISPTVGTSFSGAVATFTGSAPTGTSADFTATVAWGDGATTTPATISGSEAAGYTVSGSHTYARQGAAVPLAVIVTDKLGAHTISNPVNVADTPLVVTSTTIGAAAGTPFNGSIATLPIWAALSR